MLSSFLFAVEAVTPIFLLMVLGYLLKIWGLAPDGFPKAANKLVFRVFLPANLFLNVYGIPSLSDIDLSYVWYSLGVVVTLFLLGIPTVIAITSHADRRGPCLQAIFRSNFALVGLPLAGALFGKEGETVATLLSAVAIPAFNVLAVIALSLFSESGEKPSMKKIALGILKNPLILSIAAGVVALTVRALFSEWGVTWRLSDLTVIYTPVRYLSGVATPLALLVMGMQFEFSAVKALRREIITATLGRVCAAPLLGVGLAYLCFRNVFSGAHFAAFVALFATPVAVSSVPMTQEMGGDTSLAGQIVVFTTIFSAVSIFIASFLLRLSGIF